MSDTASLNSRYAHRIVKSFQERGIDTFFVASGMRTIPLAVAIGESGARTYVHFDERSLAFFAMGYAKGSGRAAALLCSSGTAVPNLFPAIAEASHSQIPLVMMTSDRPHELSGVGANQTLDQVKIFEPFTRWFHDLPTPSSEIPEAYYAKAVSHALFAAERTPAGPVQLNCRFREPLDPARDVEHLPTNLATRYQTGMATLSKEELHSWAKRFHGIEEGIIVAGTLPTYSSPDLFLALSDALGWPLFPTLLSQLRGRGGISHFETTFESLRPRAILQFGDTFISKYLLRWMKKSQPEIHCHVASHPFLYDPLYIASDRIECDPLHFATTLLTHLPERRESSWQKKALELDREARSVKDEIFQGREESEPGLFHLIEKLLPSGWNLFSGTSMPVRDAESFFFPVGKEIYSYANRGCSGIDGTVATAAGIAAGSKRPTLAVLGDLAVLYDVNALALISKLDVPFILIVVNNGGGGIFNFFPVAERGKLFEELIAVEHNYRFEAAAKLFNLPYKTLSPGMWREGIQSAMGEGMSCILELTTRRDENVKAHEELSNLFSQRLNRDCALLLGT